MPFYWWLLVLSPVLLAVVIVGVVSDGFRMVIQSAAFGGAMVAQYLIWAVYTHRPGHGKFLIENPFGFWVQATVAAAATFSAPCSLARLGRRVWG